ncbi:HTH-type transcriptional repressor RspR [Sulfitobacter indolifex]|uniref:GntR-family transcriptional regulator n=1 Tax=Sulfitobacter indolifex HEL-45 TaxID=391624 RepID=A0ABM9X8K8_9RHOB|nr:GntR family transcriptional regulator [Sulfitobacter indolifex]EDQ05843.1 GntR-family transcriptional regulator [Sulfitobacter indolifex HEL-45]UOA20012.1 HTH-type transcriptional repressor RspR [Sulfitobacter indolifex]
MADKTETLGDTTFKRLKAMILDGTLEPGTRLSEKKFADHLGVSRTPVREAIGQLVSEGLAKRSAGSAPVVSSVSLNEIMEILHVRSLLECEASRKAASSGKSTAELSDIRNKMQGFIDGPRPTAAEHSALDMRLHFILAEMAGSNLLLELIESLKVKTGMYDQGSIPDRLVPGCEEHIALIDAVIAGEPEAASAAMKLHLSNVRKSIISHIYHPF